MKTKLLFPVWFAAIFLAFNFTSRAGDGRDGQGDCETNNCDTNCCDINGTESMFAVIVLDATTNAPADALGIAKIDSDNNCGNTTTTIDLKTFGLAPGDYDLVIGLEAEGTNVVIGEFTVGGGDCDNGDQGGGYGGWSGWGGGYQQDHLGVNFGGDNGGQWIPCGWGGCDNWGDWTNWTDDDFCQFTNFPVITRTEAELPPGIDPSDIGSISVTDTNDNTFLFGDVTNPAPSSVINISATVRVMPGVAAPSTTGTAHLQSTATKGKWTHQFSLSASGMTSKSTYKLNVNGKISGAAKATKSGDVAIKKLPSHTPALRSLIMLDSKGKEAASAHF
jgi:hypothetical protein